MSEASGDDKSPTAAKSPTTKAKSPAKARAAPSRRAGGDTQSRFMSAAKDFCDNELRCSYVYSLTEEPSSSATRVFKAVFSKPTPVRPFAPARIEASAKRQPAAPAWSRLTTV